MARGISSAIQRQSEFGHVVAEHMGDAIDGIKEDSRFHLGRYGPLGKADLFIAHCLEVAWQAGLESTSFLRLCDSVLEYARGPFQQSM